MPSWKTKFEVHWAPAVKTWTPGWIVADFAGAQAEELAGAISVTASARAVERKTILLRNGASLGIWAPSAPTEIAEKRYPIVSSSNHDPLVAPVADRPQCR